jgi:CHASE3 domain sensor protein
MQIAPETAAELRRILIGDAARLVVAIVSMAIGLGSILVQWMRRNTQD